MLTPIQEAILVSLCLGGVCIWVSRIVNRTLVSACTVFWISWAGLLFAAWYSEWAKLIPPISDGAIGLVERGEAGAAVGCIIGSFLAGRASRSPHAYDSCVDRGMGQKQLIVAMMMIAATGMAYLVETLSHIGWSIQSLLFDVRTNFIAQGLTPLGRLSEYFCEMGIPLAVILARRDVSAGIRIYPIFLLTLAYSPNGFATAGRGYLVTPLIFYTLAYLSATRGQIKMAAVMRRFRMPRRKVGWRIAMTLVVFAASFTAIGELRWGATSTRPFYSRAFDMVMAYPASSITSIYPWSNAYADTQAHGRLILEWPAVQLERLGILSTDTRKDEDTAHRDVFVMNSSASNSPPTIIAFLIGDFGYDLMPVYFGVLMAISQFVTVRLDLRGFFAHCVVAMTLNAVFLSIGSNMFFPSSHCLGLMWAALFMLFTRRMPQHRHERLPFRPSRPVRT
jgi:hypothetical protein